MEKQCASDAMCLCVMKASPSFLLPKLSANSHIDAKCFSVLVLKERVETDTGFTVLMIIAEQRYGVKEVQRVPSSNLKTQAQVCAHNK